MFDKTAAIALIQESLDSLHRSNTIKNQLTANSDLVLMGSGSDEVMDSLGFVTFIMDIEERLETATDRDEPITLTDIEGFDINNPVLTVDTLANHLLQLAG